MLAAESELREIKTRKQKETILNYLNKSLKQDCSNIASLQDLMTTLPMSEKQHAALTLKRIEQRRMVEAARELKAESQRNSW